MTEQCIYKLEVETEVEDMALLGAQIHLRISEVCSLSCPIAGCDFSAMGIASYRNLGNSKKDEDTGLFVRVGIKGNCVVEGNI